MAGAATREIHSIDGEDLTQRNIEFNVSFILGGQIKGDEARLFHVYAEGNFIEATPETPYIQIGETKYGKPVLDRIIHPRLSLEEAAKCVLVSYTSTMRSNVSVGLPIDLLVYKKDALRVSSRTSIEEGDPYFRNLNDVWAAALQRAFENIPNPDLSLSGDDDRVARMPGPSAA
jgi:putative proteasome-type protease